ncbi:PIN domain-containing protein [Rhodococcus sp. T7]|uniref:PIN domain-containing protein n=1 Tax=Rhodococcus sp. T7 TaxID=627444 RepID=UPI0013C80808|nr:PIN domain-containing protein [Rhodococcus sp. T7]KAF0958310.1 hypothetical protein MLGJGCBP_08565 [Rhodococcus sp. T7]
MTTIRVVLDGCVLLSQVLNNLLLTLADAELFRPVWTPDLLDEVERDLAGERFGKSQEQAARRVRQMRRGADEQIDSLPPRGPADVPQLRAMDPAERVRVLGHTDLGNAVWAFLMTVCEDGDLLSV